MEKWGRGGIRIGGNHSVGWNGSKKGGRTRLPAQEIAGEMMKSRGNSTKRIEEEKKLHRGRLSFVMEQEEVVKIRASNTSWNYRSSIFHQAQ